MFNWVEVTKYNKFNMLSKTGKVCNRAAFIYEKIMCEVIDLMGISDSYVKLLNNKIKIELYYGQQIESGLQNKQTFIDILEYENKALQNVKSYQDINDVINYTQDNTSYRIDLKEITVFEFYSRTKYISKKQITE